MNFDPRRDRPRFPMLRSELPAGECLCDYCTGKCCRYISLPIKTPATWDDFDEIRWFLAHGRTVVYVDKETWYLLIMSTCQYLSADYQCAIYATRPKICREYSFSDCEYESDWSFDQVFEAPEQIWEYAEVMLPPRKIKATPESSKGKRRAAGKKREPIHSDHGQPS